MADSRRPTWLAQATTPAVVRRAALTALIVGALLTAINHGAALWRGQLDGLRALQIGLTVLVPYVVSTTSSIAALRSLEQLGRGSHRDSSGSLNPADRRFTMETKSESVAPSASRNLMNWLRRHRQQLVAAVTWLGLLASYFGYTWVNHLSPFDVASRLPATLNATYWGPLIYVVLYVVRPFIFFPSTVLTILGGFVFGPVLGVAYTVIASNASTALAYLLGRFFGKGLIPDQGSAHWIGRYTARLRERSFETVLIMRFIFLPYDLVTYAAGFLRIQFWPFMLATALGSIPGTLAFVGFGASIERFDGSLPALNPMILLVSFALLAISLLLAYGFRRREGKRA